MCKSDLMKHYIVGDEADDEKDENNKKIIPGGVELEAVEDPVNVWRDQWTSNLQESKLYRHVVSHSKCSNKLAFKFISSHNEFCPRDASGSKSRGHILKSIFIRYFI